MLTPPEANRVAARGHSPAIARELKRLGMQRCSESLVKRQWEDDPLRPSWYACFWRWFLALWMAHREGAEFLYEDFLARVAALRRTETNEATADDFFAQLAVCEDEHSDIIRAALKRKDYAAIRVEIADDIREKRRLLQMLDASRVRAASTV
jgi:hypothetical protein